MLHKEDYDLDKYLAIGTISATPKHIMDMMKTGVKFYWKLYEFRNSHIRYL